MTLIFISAIMWGTVGVSARLLYTVAQTNALTIGALRLLVGAPLLALACWWTLRGAAWRIARRDWLILLVLGVFAALDQAMFQYAVVYAGVTVTTFVGTASAPVIVAVASVLSRQEQPTFRLGLAVGLALVGAALLVAGQSGSDAAPNLVLGALLALISGGSYAGIVLVSRRLVGRYHSLQITAVEFSIAAVLLIVLALISGFEFQTQPAGVALIVFLGVVPTAMAHSLFVSGIKTTRATLSTLIVLLVPVIASVLATLMFGEALAPAGILGGALLLVAIYILSTE